MRASLATIPLPQGISSDAVCVSFSPSAFTFDTEPHNQLCNLASFDATLTPRTNSHAHKMYYQRFVGLSAQLCEKQGMLTSTSSSRRAATKSTAKALSLCGARCRGMWPACGAHAHRGSRCVVPRGARPGVEFARLNSPSWRVSRTASGVSGMYGQARARERARRLVHRRRFWRTATRARERVAKRCRVSASMCSAHVSRDPGPRNAS